MSRPGAAECEYLRVLNERMSVKISVTKNPLFVHVSAVEKAGKSDFSRTRFGCPPLVEAFAALPCSRFL
jgi:hypothetical protein